MNYLALDIGGSYVKYGIISDENQILERGKFKTPLNHKEEFLTETKKVYNKYMDQIKGIAISMPGRIDIYNGYAYSAGVLSYLENTNIVELFHEFTDLPVAVENDGKCAALAESWFGSLKDVNSGIALVFGTGVGGGIIIDGKLHHGHHNVGGEFSFILNSADKRNPEPFGGTGSVMTLIRAVEKVEGLEKGSLTGEEVFNKINSGNEKVYKVLEEYCDNIAYHLYNLQHIFDPEIIAIGGGISEQKVFIECLNERVDLYIEERPYLLAKPTIVQTKFKNDANLLGALANFRINQVKKSEIKLM